MTLKIFDFRCPNGHVFEAWLRSDEPDAAPAACPVCGAGDVCRLPAAPSVKPVEGTTRTEVAADVKRREAEEARRVVEAARERVMSVMREAARKAEDVGKEFPEAVRDMEKGRREKKLVRGICSPLEAAELRSEGIDVMPLPDEALEPLN
ncbi:DUF1178 family protein [Sutterella sp.]|uniref:DUF1178 family protein n=1 Tax=Sutterella sp. TaxID=1981025 RepID=UPI0026DEBAB6|nr:DUF1178 family protein [Sutterella sp.]MDO5531735.1 DUF1178 family protein [Sutterella sp.]